MYLRKLRIVVLSRECYKSLVSAPIISMGTMVLVACICFTVLFISGRAVGVQQDLLSTIDSTQTRQIIVNDMTGNGLNSTSLKELNSLEGVQWSVAFGPARDLMRSDGHSATRVSSRDVWASDFSYIGLPHESMDEWGVETFYYGSSDALHQIGIEGAFGFAKLSDGNGVSVLRTNEISSQFDFSQNTFLHPRLGADSDSVETMVVVAESSYLVPALAEAIPQVSGFGDTGSISVTTSEEFIELQKMLDGKLGVVRYDLVLGIFALGLILIALLQVSSIMMNRKEYGRRRALGASTRLFFIIIIIQNLILSISGVALGSITALVLLFIKRLPLPDLSFSVSVNIFTIFVVLGSSLITALYASTRDPASELRVA